MRASWLAVRAGTAIPVIALLAASAAPPAGAAQAASRRQVTAAGRGAVNWSGIGLTGVTATSASNAWAVGGGYGDAAWHWNGKAWASTPTPNFGPDSYLGAVAASSASSAWAVGSDSNGPQNGDARTLILRWQAGKWKRLPSPGYWYGSVLNGVAVTTGGRAFAVGEGWPNTTEGAYPLIAAWTGTKWTMMTVPGSPGTVLEAVTATSPTNAWAVGGAGISAVIMHWNGRGWAQTPAPATPEGALYDVSAASASDAWAVGYDVERGVIRTVILHWNGRAWHRVPSPTPRGGGQLYGVSVAPGGAAWAVGRALAGNTTSLTLRWTGRAWTRVPSPNPDKTIEDTLQAVTVIRGGAAWAVGWAELPNEALLFAWRNGRWQAAS